MAPILESDEVTKVEFLLSKDEASWWCVTVHFCLGRGIKRVKMLRSSILFIFMFSFFGTKPGAELDWLDRLDGLDVWHDACSSLGIADVCVVSGVRERHGWYAEDPTASCSPSLTGHIVKFSESWEASMSGNIGWEAPKSKVNTPNHYELYRHIIW